jgi:hypothetical protein
MRTASNRVNVDDVSKNRFNQSYSVSAQVKKASNQGMISKNGNILVNNT